jgi:hypothetical protein
MLRETALQRRVSPGQALTGALVVITPLAGLVLAPDRTRDILGLLIAGVFLSAAAWKAILVLATVSPRPRWPDQPPAALPRYTIVAALYDEGAVVGQLVRRLEALNYPRDRPPRNRR